MAARLPSQILRHSSWKNTNIGWRDHLRRLTRYHCRLRPNSSVLFFVSFVFVCGVARTKADTHTHTQWYTHRHKLGCRCSSMYLFRARAFGSGSISLALTGKPSSIFRDQWCVFAGLLTSRDGCGQLMWMRPNGAADWIRERQAVSRDSLKRREVRKKRKEVRECGGKSAERWPVMQKRRTTPCERMSNSDWRPSSCCWLSSVSSPSSSWCRSSSSRRWPPSTWSSIRFQWRARRRKRPSTADYPTATGVRAARAAPGKCTNAGTSASATSAAFRWARRIRAPYATGSPSTSRPEPIRRAISNRCSTWAPGTRRWMLPVGCSRCFLTMTRKILKVVAIKLFISNGRQMARGLITELLRCQTW